MNPVISITRIEIEVLPHHGSTLIVSLENVGHRPVGPGSLVAKRISKDGSVEAAELLCPIGLAPGEKTRLRQLLLAAMFFSSVEPLGRIRRNPNVLANWARFSTFNYDLLENSKTRIRALAKVRIERRHNRLPLFAVPFRRDGRVTVLVKSKDVSAQLGGHSLKVMLCEMFHEFGIGIIR
jgi:hypothetical protein